MAAQRQGVCASVEVPSIKPRYHKGNDVTTSEPLDTSRHVFPAESEGDQNISE